MCLVWTGCKDSVGCSGIWYPDLKDHLVMAAHLGRVTTTAVVALLFALGSRQSLAARLPTRPQRQHQALKVYWWPSISLRGWEAGYYGKEINFRGIARGGEGWKRNGNKWKSEGGDLVVFVGLEPNPTATQRAITGFKRVIISSTKEEEDCGPKSLSNLSCGMGLSKTTLNGQLGSGVDEI